MKLGIARERLDGERRVAATPETVKQLAGLGLEVFVESGVSSVARISAPVLTRGPLFGSVSRLANTGCDCCCGAALFCAGVVLVWFGLLASL